MEKGISVYFGFLDNPKSRLEKIKQAGFTTIITSPDTKFDWQNGTLKSQVKMAKKLGLKLSSLHASYDVSLLKYFFEEGQIGDKIERQLIKEIKIAKKYGFRCVVEHILGVPNKIGIDRMKRILKVCKKYDTPIAIENIDNVKALDYLFANIDDPYLKFCYDSGHNNVFDPERDYLKEYGDRLIALHLHDNDGKADLHTLNQYGTIDWQDIATRLAKCPSVPLDYELLLHKHNAKLTEDLTLEMCYKNACKLENMIQKAKKQIQK